MQRYHRTIFMDLINLTVLKCVRGRTGILKDPDMKEVDQTIRDKVRMTVGRRKE